MHPGTETCIQPTDLGPICQVMNINRGDKMDYLTSVSTIDFTMAKAANELAAEDTFYQVLET